VPELPTHYRITPAAGHLASLLARLDVSSFNRDWAAPAASPRSNQQVSQLANVICVCFSDRSAMACSGIPAGGLRGCIGVTLYCMLQLSTRRVTDDPQPGQAQPGTVAPTTGPVPGVVPPTARNLHGVDYPTKERRSTARLTQLLTQIPAVEPWTSGANDIQALLGGPMGKSRRASGRGGGEATNFSALRLLSALCPHPAWRRGRPRNVEPSAPKATRWRGPVPLCPSFPSRLGMCGPCLPHGDGGPMAAPPRMTHQTKRLMQMAVCGRRRAIL